MANELYTTHFGFSERPFALSPDPEFLFWSKAHGRAFAVLEYGLTTSAPLTVITGEVGTGKTTLVQALLRSVNRDIVLGLISNAQGDRGDLLRWVLNALDASLPAQTDYVSLFQHFQNFVVEKYAAGSKVVLIIDEAQNLTPHEVKTILTRAGEGTKIVLTGDTAQIDNPYVDAASNGLTYVIERFRNEPLAGHVTLYQGERSDLAARAATLL